MAALNFKVSTGDGHQFTSTPQTAIVVNAPSHQRVKIRGVSVFGKGTSNTDTPVKVELIVTTTGYSAGTAGSVVTNIIDGDVSAGETLQSSTSGLYSAEPTAGGTETITEVWDVHPQTGIVVFFPNDYMPILKGGSGCRLRVTTNQNEFMSLQLYCEE